MAVFFTVYKVLEGKQMFSDRRKKERKKDKCRVTLGYFLFKNYVQAHEIVPTYLHTSIFERFLSKRYQ